MRDTAHELPETSGPQEYPAFTAFVEPHLEKLRAAVADELWNLHRHRTPLGWSEALYDSAPQALQIMHRLYADWLDLEFADKRAAREGVYFEDALHLIARRLTG